jgi:hypothetical protein
LEGWRPAPGWSPARTTGTSSSSSAATASQGYAVPLPTRLPSLPELLRFPAAALLLISVFFCSYRSPSRRIARTARCARFAATASASPPTASASSPATSAPSQSAGTATSTSAGRARRTARSARRASSASRASHPAPPRPAVRFRRCLPVSHTRLFSCRVRARPGRRGRGRRRRPGERVQLEGQARLPVRRRVHAPRAHELRPRRRLRRRAAALPERPPPHQRPDGTPNSLLRPAAHIARLRRLFPLVVD